MPHAIYKHLYFKRIFSVKIDNQHQFKMYHHGGEEENAVFWRGIFGGWEKASMELWYKLVTESDVVFDVGANTGLYALFAQAMRPHANIFAFEPLPKVLEYLQYNCKINDFSIKVIPKAASNFTGDAVVYLQKGEDFAMSVTVNKSLMDASTPQKMQAIQTIRLDKFIKENTIEKIDLIKIDVETHEPEVLEGLGNYVKLFRPDFLIEIWDASCAEKINDFFADLGYVYFDINDETREVTRKEKVTVSSYWNYLICKPETAKKLNLI